MQDQIDCSRSDPIIDGWISLECPSTFKLLNIKDQTLPVFSVRSAIPAYNVSVPMDSLSHQPLIYVHVMCSSITDPNHNLETYNHILQRYLSQITKKMSKRQMNSIYSKLLTFQRSHMKVLGGMVEVCQWPEVAIEEILATLLSGDPTFIDNSYKMKRETENLGALRGFHKHPVLSGTVGHTDLTMSSGYNKHTCMYSPAYARCVETKGISKDKIHNPYWQMCIKANPTDLDYDCSLSFPWLPQDLWPEDIGIPKSGDLCCEQSVEDSPRDLWNHFHDAERTQLEDALASPDNCLDAIDQVFLRAEHTLMSAINRKQLGTDCKAISSSMEYWSWRSRMGTNGWTYEVWATHSLSHS